MELSVKRSRPSGLLMNFITFKPSMITRGVLAPTVCTHFLRADGNYNQAFIRQSLPGATAFADYSPDDKNICRNFNRVRGCTLHECHFADVCNRKVNEKAYGSLSFYSYEGLTLETSALEILLESCFQIRCFSEEKNQR